MRFPTTRHSAVSALRTKDESLRRLSYEAIIDAYWQPVQVYLRFRWLITDENAADLAQAFFAKTLEFDTLEAYDAARGTFRTYLRTCLDRFVINSQKQLGRIQFLPLDFDIAAAGASAEELLQREWVRNLFSLAVEDLRAGTSPVRFRVFEAYDLNESDVRPTYTQLATEFGVTTESITNYLAAARRDFRKAVLKRLRELTVSEREFRLEARTVLGVVD
jgi:RNA polymerase sigma-70 factor (ECF subfamily)